MTINTQKNSYCILFLFLLFSYGLKGQKGLLDLKMDTLHTLLDSQLQKKDYVEYYNILRRYERDNYKKLPQILHMTDTLWRFRGASHKDSLSYRKNLANKASYLKKVNDYPKALKYYLKSHEFQVYKNGSLFYAWYIENPIAHIYFRQNDLEQAIYFYKLVIPHLLKKKDYSNLSRLYGSLAKAYREKADYENEQKYYSLQEKILLEITNSKSHIAYYSNQVELAIDDRDSVRYKMHIEEAMLYCEKMRRDKDPSYSQRFNYLLRLKSDWAAKNGDYDSAIEILKVVIANTEEALSSSRSRELAKMYNRLANLYLDSGQINRAKKEIERGLQNLLPNHDFKTKPSDYQISNENTFYELYYTKASYSLKEYQNTKHNKYLDTLIESVDLALYANKDLEEQLLQRGSKYISTQSNKKLVELVLQALMFKQKHSGKSLQTTTLARKYFDQSKSSIYLENRKNKYLLQNSPKNKKATLDSLQNVLVELHSENYKGDEEVESEIVTIQKEIKKIENEVLELQFIEGSIKNYIEYVVTDSMTYILSDIKDGCFSAIPTKEMEEQIIIIRNKINNINDDKLEYNLKILADILIPFELKGTQKINIIPDGTLHFLPFDILRKNDKYLIEDYCISYQLHRRKLVQSEIENKVYNTYCLFPEYEEDENILQLAMQRNLGTLPYAETEVNAIDSIFPNVIIQRRVSMEDLTKSILEANLFHYAGHGYGDRSKMYLSIRNHDNELTNLSEQQILFMQNNLDLVCLSACETGLGEVQSGEGVRSVASSFLNSGARSVVQSLWKVDDRSTSEIITNFYKNLKKGEDKPTALRNAKLTYLNKERSLAKHPYYWAGLTFIGEETSLFEKNLNWQLPTIILIGFIFFFFYVKRKNEKAI